MVEDMSKVNAMQAIREARYAARTSARTTVRPAAPDAPGIPVGAPVAAAVPVATVTITPAPGIAAADLTDTAVTDSAVTDGESAAEVTEVLCGHRSMNNRSCRRPAGHAEKNHRYN